MSPLSLKYMFELSQPTFDVRWVPSSLAQVIVAGPVCSAYAGKPHKDVPITISAIAVKL